MNAQEALLAKADQFLRSATLLAQAGDLDSAVSRTYYAAFHTATALLHSLGQAHSTHRALISAYGREFAKKGVLDVSFHHLLTMAFTKRQQADYRHGSVFSGDEVEQLIDEARRFLKAAREWLAGRTEGPSASPSDAAADPKDHL